MSWTVILFKAPKSTDTRQSQNNDDKFLTHLKTFEENRLVSSVRMIEVLDFEFTGLGTLFEALQDTGHYEGLILTSPRCVESIRRCIDVSQETKHEWEVNLKVKWTTKRIFCIGTTTSESIRDLFGLGCQNTECPVNVVTSSVSTSEGLGKVILEDAQKDAILLPLLYPGGNLQSDTLSAILDSGGIPYRSITTYRTIPNPKLLQNLEALKCNRSDAKHIYVFFSPSGLQFALPHLRYSLTNSHFIAVGPTTRATLQNVPELDGARIHQCSTPTPEALHSVVESLLI